MTTPTSKRHAHLRLCVALGLAAIIVPGAPQSAGAQGLVKGVEQGATVQVKVDPDDPQSLLVWGAAS